MDSVAQAPLSSTVSWSLLKFMTIEWLMMSNHLIIFFPLFLLLSVFSSLRVFSVESALHIRWLKYWSFSFSISPSSEYSGLMFFRIDWLDLLAVQGLLCTKQLGVGAVTVRVIRMLLPSQALQERAKNTNEGTVWCLPQASQVLYTELRRPL